MENPFSGKVACIPTSLTLPSRKVRYWIHGTMSTNGDTVGGANECYIKFNPYCILNVDHAVIATTSAWPAQTFPDDSGTGTGVAPYALNSEYATLYQTSVDTYDKFRVVGAGLRVRYSDTELNRGGYIVGIEEPNHFSLSTSVDLADMSRFDTYKAVPATREWMSVVWHPREQDELNWFIAVNGSFGGADDRTQTWPLGFAIKGPGSTAVTYEFEACVIAELTGSTIRGLTPSESDAVGMSRVISTVSNTSARAPKVGDRAGWVRAAFNRVIDTGVSTAMSMAGAYMGIPPVASSSALQLYTARDRVRDNVYPLIEEADS
jgi:hypothetical protein